MQFDPFDSQALIAQFRSAARPLIALDYDGTLVDLTHDPFAASPDLAVLDLLRRLTLPHQVEVAIVTGRDADTIAGWLGDLPVHIVAEHGFQRRMLGEPRFKRTVTDLDLGFLVDVRREMQKAAEKLPGASVEMKPASATWHYRQADAEAAKPILAELHRTLTPIVQKQRAAFLPGHHILEVRGLGFDKGVALSALVDSLPGCDFVLTAGDDVTDEDMFEELPRLKRRGVKNVWGLHVGTKQKSQATTRVNDVAQLRAVLAALAAVS